MGQINDLPFKATGVAKRGDKRKQSSVNETIYKTTGDKNLS